MNDHIRLVIHLTEGTIFNQHTAVAGEVQVIRSVGDRGMKTNDVTLGDFVQLRTGGPPMVVLAILDDGRIECIWHEDGEQCTDEFDPSMLVKITRNDCD